jgi:hypothetical protein
MTHRMSAWAKTGKFCVIFLTKINFDKNLCSVVKTEGTYLQYLNLRAKIHGKFLIIAIVKIRYSFNMAIAYK